MTTATPPRTYAPRLVRCNVNATTVNGEQVVNTIWVQFDTLVVTTAVDKVQRVADRVRDSWATMVTTGYGASAPALAALFHTETKWTSVDAYAVDSAGRATAQAEALFDATVKGSGTSLVPQQLALCVTLLTKRAGRRGRGRIYLGGLGAGVFGADGRVSAAQSQQISDTMAGTYVAIRDQSFAGDEFRPVVVSPTGGTADKIIKVQTGNYMDTIRSRRNKVEEGRTSAVVDAT